MFKLNKIEHMNYTADHKEIIARLKNINIVNMKPIHGKSLHNSVFLKFMKQILINTTSTPVVLKLTIKDQNNKLFTETVTRKKLRNPIRSFKYVHFIKK